MRKGFAGVVGALLLAGCAIRPVPTTVDTPGMPNPEAALRDSMRHVDAEMAQLGRMTPSQGRAAAVSPGDLERIVSFDFEGPLDKAVAKLALSIGYTFYTSGPSGAREVPVAVRLANVTALQALRTLGEQAGTAATVEVDPLHHQVQVIHHV